MYNNYPQRTIIAISIICDLGDIFNGVKSRRRLLLGKLGKYFKTSVSMKIKMKKIKVVVKAVFLAVVLCVLAG